MPRYIDIMRQLANAPVQERRDRETGWTEVTAGYSIKNSQVYSQEAAALSIVDLKAEAEKVCREHLQDYIYGDLRLELVEILELVESLPSPRSRDGWESHEKTLSWLRSLIDQLTPYSGEIK